MGLPDSLALEARYVCLGYLEHFSEELEARVRDGGEAQ